MRVALFTDTYVPEVNGVAKTLGRWTAFLESQGVPCKVFAPAAEDRFAADRSSVERLSSVPFLLYPDCKFALPNPIHVKKALREFEPTIVHVATPFNIGFYGSHYARKRGIPLVASYHTHFDQYLSYYKLQWMEPVLMKYMSWFHADCRKVYVPSRSAKAHLEPHGFPEMEIWGRGIDASLFRPEVDRDAALRSFGVDPDAFVVLYVGRLAPEKSVDVLLEAYRSLPEAERAGMELVIAGDGPLYKELVASIAPGERIRALGFVEGRRLAELYAAADVFLFPSATETFGNVVLEAMASGTAVVGAAAGGVLDSVRHGETGWLCPPRDAGAFAEALLRLRRDASLRARLAAAGTAYARSQSWDAIFHKLLRSYEEVVRTSGEPVLL
ncbi:glycosyltransferase family 1 protein [Paenibacillus sp.]|uniref:glycosyltransferase family 4 protein n=1 Tax=Paenibacillus sp. TaxID=58172 RepID=UPI002D64DD0D|nr:glycosyltransferase family 1 protein [Paenibacillus sp.]HZG56476.1 glycosyltransferase family 1 protein [Paenibacillus sp.]